jgi:hypothetical protein
MQDRSHLTIILCSRVIKIVISQKQKVNRKNNNNYDYYSCFLNFFFFFFFFLSLAPENFQTHT